MFRPASQHMRSGILAMAFALLWMLATDSHAQDFERYRPRTPDNSEGQPDLPEQPAEATGYPTELVEELKGLVFLDHKDQVTEEQVDAVGVDVRSLGLHFLRSREFDQIAGRYLGKPVSILSLNQLVRDIIIMYRRNDRPVVDVSVPEQDITGGVVQIVVVEGRVGRVRVNTRGYFNPCMLANQTCVRKGDLIHESFLLEDLRWLNQNPYREVDLRLRAGEEYGDTDIIFDVRDRRPITAYAGYEDTGVQALGLERTIYGLTWGNAFGRDHTAGFQYTADSTFSRLNAFSGVYSIPTQGRNSFSVFGSYAKVDSDIAFPFDQGGSAWQTSARYNFELFPGACCPRTDQEHHLQVGVDFKRSDTNLDFGGINLFNTTTDVAQLMVGYNGRRQDPYGVNSVSAELYYSPGGLTGPNTDPAYRQVRPFASANYIYTQLRLQRYHRLPKGFTFFLGFHGQLANGNLLPSEQMGFGGYNTVRGYDQRAVNGDSGILLNAEIRTPSVQVLGDCRGKKDELQFLVFYDQGWAYNHQLLPFESSAVDLSSVGFGFRYSIAQRVALRFDWGWQLSSLPRTLLATENNRVHIGAVVSY